MHPKLPLPRGWKRLVRYWLAGRARHAAETGVRSRMVQERQAKKAK